MELKLIFLVFVLIPVAYGSVQVDSQTFLSINNADINFSSTQTFDNIEIGTNYIILNSSTLQIIPTNNINVTVNQYLTQNNVYNISTNGTANVNINQIPTTSGTYTFLRNSISIGILSTVGGILYKTYTITGMENFVWYLIPSPITELTCQSVNSDINAAFGLIGVLLIVFAAGMLISGIRSMNYPFMIVGIGAAITGAIMIIIGYFVTVTVSNGVGCLG